jgi:hypothetical protein
MVLAGCKAKEALDKVSIAKDLEKHGTTDLMKDVANDKYTPPADGKLTEAQVQMYLKVREHEKQIAQVAKDELKQHADDAKKAGDKSLSGMMEGFKALGSAANLLTADIRAAKDLGYNTQEYLWVKGKILEVSTTAMGEKFAEATSATMDQAYQQAKKSMDEAKDETTRKMYAEMIAGLDKQKQEAAAEKLKTANEKPELAYNKELLSKHESALNAFAQEMAKFEDKPGDAQKSVEKLQQDLDKAKEDGKKSQ